MAKLEQEHAFSLEIMPEEDGSRCMIHSWGETEGYVQITYQEWEEGEWNTISRTPVISTEDFLKVAEVIKFMKEKGVIK